LEQHQASGIIAGKLLISNLAIGHKQVQSWNPERG
jgi:hypothetical protein